MVKKSSDTKNYPKTQASDRASSAFGQKGLPDDRYKNSPLPPKGTTDGGKSSSTSNDVKVDTTTSPLGATYTGTDKDFINEQIGDSLGLSVNTIVPPFQFSLNQSYLDQINNANNAGSSQSSVEVNKKYAITESRAEPLFSVKIEKSEIDQILAKAYSFYLEDSCSMEFSKKILKIALENNKDLFLDLNKKITAELQDCTRIFDFFDGIFKSLYEIDESLKNFDSTFISNLIFSNFAKEDFYFEDNTTLSRISSSPKDIVKDFSKGDISNLRASEYVSFCLMFLRSFFENSSTPLILENKAVDLTNFSNSTKIPSIQISSNNSDQSVGWRLSSKPKIIFQNLSFKKAFGVPGGSYAQATPQDALRNILNIQINSDVSSVRKVAFISSVLANEFCISAGLRRILGNKNTSQSYIGSKDVSQNYFDSAIGNFSGQTDLFPSPENFNGSLRSYITANSVAINFLDGTQTYRIGAPPVALLENSNYVSSKKGTNPKNPYEVYFKNFLDISGESIPSYVYEDLLNESVGAYDKFLGDYKNLRNEENKLKLLRPVRMFSVITYNFGKCLKSAISDIKSSKITGNLAELIVLKFCKSNGKFDFTRNYLINNITRYVMFEINEKKGVKDVRADIISAFGDDEVDRNIIKSMDIAGTFYYNKIWNNLTKEVNAYDLSKAASDYSPASYYEVTFASLYGLTSCGKRFTDQENYIGIQKLIGEIAKELILESYDVFDGEDPLINRVTANNHFTISTVVALVFECMHQLCSEFLDVELTNITQANGSVTQSYYTTADAAKLNYKSSDQGQRVNFTYYNYSARTLKDSINKMSNLADLLVSFGTSLAAGGIEQVEKVEKTFKPLPLFTKSNVSSSSILKIYKDLCYERDIPAGILCSIKSLYQSPLQKSKDLFNISRQIWGLTSNINSEVQSFLDFSKTDYGKKYLSSLSDLSLEISKSRQEKLSQGFFSDYGRRPKLSLGEYLCIKENIKNILTSPNSSDKSVTVSAIGLPRNYIRKTISSNFSLFLDKSSGKVPKLSKVVVSRFDNFSENNTKNFERFFYCRPLLFEGDFDFYSASNLKDLDSIASSIVLRSGGFGSFESSKYKQKDFVKEVIKNEIVSYLLTKLFSSITCVNFFAENLVDDLQETRADNCVELARIFAKIYGLPENTFDSCFTSDKKIDIYSFKDLVTSKITTQNSKTTLDSKKISSGEAEIFLDLFSTIYFYTGKIRQLVFSNPVIEKVFCLPIFYKDFSEKEPEIQFDTYTFDVVEAGTTLTLKT